MNSQITTLLGRNEAWAETETHTHVPRLPFLPFQGLYVITCIDPRVDPAEFLGLGFADAIVARTVGGRATPAVIQDLSYIGYSSRRRRLTGLTSKPRSSTTPTAAAVCSPMTLCVTDSRSAPGLSEQP